MNSAPTWTCQRSVDVDVAVPFAWHFMTDVRNWNDPPAEFALDGRFATGARGTTSMPGRPPVHWTIEMVDLGRAYTLRTSLSDAVSMLFHWQFEPLSAGTTRMTQRLELCGENAADYINDVRAAFESNLEPGMQRIARLMQEAAGSSR